MVRVPIPHRYHLSADSDSPVSPLFHVEDIPAGDYLLIGKFCPMKPFLLKR